jgi:hypothetical protein
MGRTRFALVLAVAALAAGVFAALSARSSPGKNASRTFDCEDAKPGEGEILVAVVDTGVDAGHPALKGRCLKPVDLSGIPATGRDAVGHGTAMAGLICADDENDEFDGACAKVAAVRILPVKVAAGREALPQTLAMGIESAIDGGARIVLVAMGMSFTTDKLEEVMKKAQEKDVLVIAPAGFGKVSCLDLYPAAHPWALSVTGTLEKPVAQPEGGSKMMESSIFDAYRSGKTEVMALARAKVITPGGGHSELEGTSVSAARTAGQAARLLAAHPKLTATRLREILKWSGSAEPENGAWRGVPARVLTPKSIDAYCEGEGKPMTDLVLVAAEPNQVRPGKKSKVRVVVRNNGSKAAGGEFTIQAWKPEIISKCAVPEVAPGKEVETWVEMAEVPEGKFTHLRAEVKCEGDVCSANDVLFLDACSYTDEPFIGFDWVTISGFRDGGGPVRATCRVANEGDKNYEFVLRVPGDEKNDEIKASLKSCEAGIYSIEFVTEPLEAGKIGLAIDFELIIAGQVAHRTQYLLDASHPKAAAQYADLWATREFIFDAPAFVANSRSVVPLIAFVPEMAGPQLSASYAARLRKNTMVRGIWLDELLYERVHESVAVSATFDPDALQINPLGKSLLHTVRTPQASVRTRVHSDFPSAPFFLEDANGSPMDLDVLPHWISEDNWSAVHLIPKTALDPEPASDEFSPGNPVAFIRCASMWHEMPGPMSGGGFSWANRQRQIFTHISEAILRIQFDVDLADPLARGQYLDTHVHTASEFSRRLVEPRLAFGGPLWMILRSAHAMGLVDDATLMRARARIAAKGLDLDPAHSGTAIHTILTTDHNCFLTDEDIPDAAPYAGTHAGAEIQVLRRFFGYGANQELAMATPGRMLGAAHALTYGADPMFGPWHGGRGIGEALQMFFDALNEMLVLGDMLEQFGNETPPLEDLLYTVFRTLKYGPKAFEFADPDISKKLRAKLVSLLEKTCKIDLSEPDVDVLIDSWGDKSKEDFRGLLDEVRDALQELKNNPHENPWKVDHTEEFLLGYPKGSYIAAHPFLDTKNHGVRSYIHEDVPLKPGALSWEEHDLKLASNLSQTMKLDRFRTREFPFKGMQIWNEPQYFRVNLGRPEDIFQANPWATGRLRPNVTWYDELSFGFQYYLREFVRPGLRCALDISDPVNGRNIQMIRKLYILAGSDAHGSFNYTSGHGGSLLTHPDFGKLFAVFGCSHGSYMHTSHFAAARVYAEEPSLDAVTEGRCVCTDGPVAWATLDTDTRFDSDTGIWHDSWTTAMHAKNDDGEIGGRGPFDGMRTALARRDAADAALRVLVEGTKGQGGDVKRCELFTVAASDTRVPRVASGMSVPWVTEAESWAPGAQGAFEARELPESVALSEPRALLFGAYTASDASERFSIRERRCLTNPIWISTVDIRISAKPKLVAPGKAIVPPRDFEVEFHADHSMLDEKTVVLAKQLNEQGDSVARTVPLVVRAEPREGPWRKETRTVGGQEIEVADVRMTASNDDVIPLAAPWYPKEGVMTFAVILANPKDAHGNRLNAIAAKVAVVVPEGGMPLPDPAETPDTSGGGNPPTKSAGDVTTVTVKGGEQVDLPRGAKLDGKPIPPGSWTVPSNVPEAGIPLLVTCGVQTFTLLLTTAATSPAPALQRGDGGFLGKVPTQGTAKPDLFVRNSSDNTAVVGDPLIVTPGTCVFNAPELGPGSCTISATQNGQKKTYTVEAVAAVLAWDVPTANVGDRRVLSIVLQGASKPSEWVVKGTFMIANGEVVQADSRVRRREDGTFAVDGWPGDAGRVATVRATQAGKMTATSTLAAVKASGN